MRLRGRWLINIHGHIHCDFNMNKELGNPTSLKTIKAQEASCYQWEIKQARAWGLEQYANHMEVMYNTYYKSFSDPRYKPSISITSKLF